MTREPGRAPPRHAHGNLTSLAPHERLPEILVVPRGAGVLPRFVLAAVLEADGSRAGLAHQEGTVGLFREPAWSAGATVTLPDPSHSAGAYTLSCDNFSQWTSRKQSSLSGKESAQGCIPKRLPGRPDSLHEVAKVLEFQL